MKVAEGPCEAREAGKRRNAPSAAPEATDVSASARRTAAGSLSWWDVVRVVRAEAAWSKGRRGRLDGRREEGGSLETNDGPGGVQMTECFTVEEIKKSEKDGRRRRRRIKQREVRDQEPFSSTGFGSTSGQHYRSSVRARRWQAHSEFQLQ